ncbi:MAG: hypothetical protein QG570_557 [Patescibacteria group bacterium]|nr:hypothetical protein [Patescibacteria group bacterium]
MNHTKGRFILISILIVSLCFLTWACFTRPTNYVFSPAINRNIFHSDSVTVTGTDTSTTNKIKLETSFTPNSIFDKILDYDSENDSLLIVAGDVMLGRTVNTKTVDSGSFNWPYKNIPNFFPDEAITFINLENPLTKECRQTDIGMLFCGDQSHAQYIQKNNIDIVSLANNHTLNHGVKGLMETTEVLGENGIRYTGVANPTWIEDKNNKFLFLGFDHLECNQNYIECMTDENVVGDVKRAKAVENSFVVVMFHWGNEYTYTPTEGQKHFAQLAIDSGADLVLGNHPHWYQKLEMYKGKLIMYSHGNFIFDQMWSEGTKEGLVGKYVIKDGKLKDVEFVPIYIENFGQPRIANEDRAKKILNNLYNISKF